MAPRTTERDDGMRRISSTTRWLVGVGAALVAAFSLLFAERASSGASSTPSVDTPVATSPSVNGGDVGSSSGSGSSAQPAQTAPRVTYPPQQHTRSGGS